MNDKIDKDEKWNVVHKADERQNHWEKEQKVVHKPDERQTQREKEVECRS
ncbi:hypothetical protein [Metabacillus litoralis]|nr:hypothetical protein [Metabacillus litoralis]MCM3413379.1 hypothetical protein [Metabacillus litoralis]